MIENNPNFFNISNGTPNLFQQKGGEYQHEHYTNNKNIIPTEFLGLGVT